MASAVPRNTFGGDGAHVPLADVLADPVAASNMRCLQLDARPVSNGRVREQLRGVDRERRDHAHGALDDGATQQAAQRPRGGEVDAVLAGCTRAGAPRYRCAGWAWAYGAGAVRVAGRAPLTGGVAATRAPRATRRCGASLRIAPVGRAA